MAIDEAEEEVMKGCSFFEGGEWCLPIGCAQPQSMGVLCEH